jgi:Membrane bound beta barrel domain (DUF5777)
MKNNPVFSFFICLLFAGQLSAQDNSLLNKLNDSMSVHAKPLYVSATFKATHVVNMQTVEAPAGGALSFLIQHRFGALNTGIYNFFGLDNANTRLGLEYGITDRLAVGAGRSSLYKTYDGFLKYKLLRQTDGSNRSPVTLSILGTISNFTDSVAQYSYPFESSGPVKFNASDRTAYTAQLLIARKFTRNLSIELAPTYLHYNVVPSVNDKNNIFELGAGARMKITRRMSINAEYNYLPSGQLVSYTTHNCFSLGWDIETGGHVFQLVFSNSQSMIESQYLTQTPGSWGKGDIYFGFNISRNFNLSKKAKGNSNPKS